MARRTSKKSSARKRTTKSNTKKQIKRDPILAGIPPQRRIDIFGILLLVIGLLTLISLFTRTTGSVTGWWITNLSIAMGWDVYLLPLALIGIGAWMLLRNMDKLPQLSVERIVGFLLFFINLSAWFHLFIDGGFSEAKAGTGGGYVGAFFKITFVRTLGKPGAVIALIAWLLISLILMLDLSMASLLKTIGDFIGKIYDKLSKAIQERLEKAALIRGPTDCTASRKGNSAGPSGRGPDPKTTITPLLR